MRIYCLFFVSILLAGCASTPSYGPPYSPEQSVQTLEVVHGFEVELFASEPLIQDPVDMTVDERGRMYVVEMPGYPLDTSGSGRIKMLHDTDGDGYPDQATLFAHGLTLPNGIMPWKDGVLVTDAPDVLYYEDTDGDGISDVREVILTGFALTNPQYNVNNPLYGIDNWIYLSNYGTVSWTEKFADTFGDEGGEIYYASAPDAVRLPRNAHDRNVRFRPDSFELEMRSNSSQFGHTFNEWGHHFLNDNSHPIFHEALAGRYMERNLNVAVAEAAHYSFDHGPQERIFPITIDPEHQLLTDRGVFTSACGITWYHGGVFPAPYDRNVTFSAEPVHNVVFAAQVRSSGSVFTASRLTEGHEFLASTDGWFRPVNFSVGPDGALYVVDYYRQIVEHPEWMDDAVVEAGDLQQGSQMGRIYRVVPEGAPSPSWLNAIESMTTEQYVERLSDPNGWWRTAAQRVLVTAQDTSVVAHLRQQLDQQQSAEGYLHTLWTLHGLGALHTDDILNGLMHAHPHIRENAIILAEMDSTGWRTLGSHLLQMAKDPDPQVRYQLLLTLGIMEMDSEDVRSAQEEILLQGMDDHWVQIAAQLSIPSDRLLSIAMRHADEPALLEKIASMMVRERNVKILFDQLLTENADRQWWFAPLLRGMASASVVPTDNQASQLIDRMWYTEDESIASAILDLLPRKALDPVVIETSKFLAQDEEALVNLRNRAIRVLSKTKVDPDILLQLFTPDAPLDLQLEVLRGLRSSQGVLVAEHILGEWERLTPRLRNEALPIFNTAARAHLFVEALESGVVSPSELSWGHRVFLMRDTPEPTRSRARALLRTIDESVDLSTSDLDGDIESGAVVYATVCASCHARGFGPDLSTVRHWSEPMLTAAIIKPSQAISTGYELWEIATVSGDTLQGVVASETASALHLLNEKTDQTISRSEIISVTPVTRSAMPEDLIGDPQELADVIAFVKQL